MITDDQYAAWFSDSTAQRVTLFEVGFNNGSTRYLSNKAYGGGSASTPYLAVVVGGLKMTQSISLVSEATLSTGDIELVNLSGALDSWLDDNFVNEPVSVFVGDVRWPRADFRQIFVGRIADIDGTKSRDRINLRLRDKFQQLNGQVTDAQMGAGAASPEALRPVLLGEVHNLTPKLKNSTTKEYEFNDGASERLIEVRTDGKTRTVAENLAAGSFTFTDAVGPGAVTCSAQGVKPDGVYTDRIAPLIKYLVKSRGKVDQRFTDADLDLDSLAAFDAAHPQCVGLYLTERTNVIDACHQLASSVGAQFIPTRGGLAKLIQIAFPTTATTEIHANVQLDRSISLVAQTAVVGAVKVGYARNYTLQPNLPTSLPLQHKEWYDEEFFTATASDPTVITAYGLDAAPVQQNTCLQDAAEAQAEAERRLDIFKVKRKTYRFEGTPANMLLELGQAVKLFSNRYNLGAGKVGIVTSLSPDWDNFHVTVEITV